jgi:AAA15 family ATPase/GTPase
MPGHGNPARFRRVLELEMAAFGGDLHPAVLAKAPKHLTDLHNESERSPGRGQGRSKTVDGLKLVVGRDGSGKSSFAEALELLRTGDTYCCAQRTKVWKSSGVFSFIAASPGSEAPRS